MTDDYNAEGITYAVANSSLDEGIDNCLYIFQLLTDRVPGELLDLYEPPGIPADTIVREIEDDRGESSLPQLPSKIRKRSPVLVRG